jgi:3-hydroxyisobutyrate dehydrogenase-like beta-hydroxyacid dehydrogenase
MLKDMELVQKTVNEYDQPLHLADPSAELYRKAVSAGFGRLDFAAIYKYLDS